jgi:ribosomal 50S subunit-associated protein YjgA (DUF615 family)
MDLNLLRKLAGLEPEQLNEIGDDRGVQYLVSQAKKMHGEVLEYLRHNIREIEGYTVHQGKSAKKLEELRQHMIAAQQILDELSR